MNFYNFLIYFGLLFVTGCGCKSVVKVQILSAGHPAAGARAILKSTASGHLLSDGETEITNVSGFGEFENPTCVNKHHYFYIYLKDRSLPMRVNYENFRYKPHQRLIILEADDAITTGISFSSD